MSQARTNKMDVLVMLVFVLVSARYGGCGSVAPVAWSIGHHIHADCWWIITTSIEEDPHVAATLKFLSSRQLKTASLRMSTLAADTQAYQHPGGCLRSLHVILSDSQLLRNQLQQLSLSNALARTTWLLFIPTAAAVEQIFQGINVPFDCVFLLAEPLLDGFRFSEVYRVAARWPLKQNKFGEWLSQGGFVGPKVGLYTRRTSLDGLVLTTTNNHDPPMSILSTNNNRTQLAGFSGAVWKIFERRINFRSIHTEPSLAEVNSQGNATWSGMIGAVLRADADVTATTIIMTSNAAQVVDFIFPLYTVYSRIYIKLPDSNDIVWDNFLTPFSTPLWLAFLVSALATAVLLALLYHAVRRFDDTEELYPLNDAIFLVFGAIFCQQGHDRCPRSVPCRIVHILMYATAVVAINSYSGSIISNLAVYQRQMPFTNLEGLYNDRSYSLGLLNTSPVSDIFKNTQQSYVKELYLAKNSPADSEAGFRRVCDTTFAFVSTAEEESVVRDKLNCTIVQLPEHFVKFSASLAFPKNSPYVGLFNHNLMKLINSGVISNLYKSSVQERIAPETVESGSIGMADVTPIIAIMCGGIMLGLVLLVLEHLMSCCNRTRELH